MPAKQSRSSGGMPSPHDLLRWVYVGRVIVPLVVFVAAAFNFRAVPPGTLVILAIAALAGVTASGLSLWHTHARHAVPGRTFLYAQALFDLALVTTVFHVFEGAESQFPALYILVIVVSAVLMPLTSSLMVTSLASLLYVADIVWWQPVQLSVVVWLQIGVFVGVFIATALIASRVRVVGASHEDLEREVRRLKLEASDILRTISSGILTVDGQGRLLFANPAALKLLQLSDPDATGRPLAELVGGRAPELLRAIELTQRGVRQRMRAEGVVRTTSGSFPIGLTTTALEVEPDAPPSVAAIFTDISGQKRIEALRLRTERLEAVAELSASLAHEIKNPLASIRSSVEQLSRSARADPDERFLAELVLRESDRLSRLLTEFLDFSRVKVTHCLPVDLAAVVVAAVNVVHQHPDCPQDAAIEVKAGAAHLEGDEDLLHRVVVNLVLNAVQAGAGVAGVVVEVFEADGDQLPSGVPLERAIVLRVTDDGPGIPPELRDRLFDPFVTGRAGGSGLGLAIVHRAVQAHRGFVLVESGSGRGTTFTVLLPTTGPAEAAA